jgi:uncharacterized protein (TIGR02099 family)
MDKHRDAPASVPAAAGLPREPAPPGTGLHRVGAFLWVVLVVLVVLLALYVSVGRYGMSQIGAARGAILAQLNERLPFNVDAASLSGGWDAFSPRFTVQDLVLTQRDGDAPPLRVGQGTLRLDVPGSLAAGSLQLSELEISGLALAGRVTAEGGIEIEGFAASGSGALQSWLREFLPRVRLLTLLDSTLSLAGDGGVRELQAELSLAREGNQRILNTRLRGAGLSLEGHASGLGNPLAPLSWSGDIFVDVASEDLAGLNTLWSALDWPFTLAGSARAQLWLSRRQGDSSARMRLDGSAVQLEERSGAWSLPLDALAFEAALSQARNQWTLLAEDLHAERGDSDLDLSRVQFDWSGSSLRVRASDLGLDALPTLLAAAPGIPAGLREALPALAPSGSLRSIELRLDDLAAPAESWSLRGLLDDVSVESWRGAPGVSGVSGFLALQPGSGRLQLDAGPFSMRFPQVYREALSYASAFGDLSLRWDPTSLRIESGLIRARGDEGEVRALVAVDLPFQDRVTGPEMELLAGLSASSAVHRDKYLPYVLPQPLLDWLADSVQGGDAERVGFLWRGSLLRRNYPHMTLQLFVDVRNGTLRFDPGWPALEDLDALVRVDDGRTWAQASRGRVLGTELEGLRVNVLPRPGGADLGVRTSLVGDAADGQRLLADSALAQITNGVFADWTLSGPVSGDLALDLRLGADPAPPDVRLNLALDGVAARVAPVDLPLESFRGTLRYDSATGFSGSAGNGLLWGRPVSATVAPGAADSLDLGISGSLDTAQIAPWLQQPLLGFADGVAEVSGELRLRPGETAMLSLQSSLEGVTLDAPAPFTKSSGQALPLALTLALTAAPRLSLVLGERFATAMDLDASGLQQLRAVVGGLDLPPPERCDATYCLFGGLSTLDLAAWSDFVARYGSLPDADAGPAARAPAGADALAAAASYRVDSLAVGDLRLGARRFGQSRLDLWGRGALWQGAVESELLQGALTRENGELQLLLERLDLAAFDGGEPLGLAQFAEGLPPLRVDVLDLRSAGTSLGFLGFDLDPEHEAGALFAHDIRGELWGIDLAPRAPGMLAWRPDGDGERTALELDPAFGDLGAALERMGYARTLESRSGSASLRLRWPGSPAAFDVRQLQGTLDLRLRQGRLTESRPGALALVSLLNLAEILRGLSLSYMFESGIPFETASADFALDRGLVRVRDLSIDGAASAFAFAGVSDLNTSTVDGELIVTLPVANNLPWVAALAGGPAVAAGVFVVSKVFEKQVNRMSSAVYQISGPLDDPEVRFRRLFDDKASADAGGSPAAAPADPDGAGEGAAVSPPRPEVP